MLNRALDKVGMRERANKWAPFMVMFRCNCNDNDRSVQKHRENHGNFPQLLLFDRVLNNERGN